MEIPREFINIGFNERILTFNDFSEYCDLDGIHVRLFPSKLCPIYGAFIPASQTPTGRPLILLGRELSGVPLLIAAFHELGHYFEVSRGSGDERMHTFEGEDYTFGNKCKEEYRAHAVAACALLPKSFLGSETLRELQTYHKLSKVERREWRRKKVKELGKKYSEYTEQWLAFRLRVAVALSM